MPEFENLILGTLKELGQQRFQNIANTLVMNQNMYRKFMGLHTPEAIAAHEARLNKERDRLAAIEAAKSPAQKLKEKQEACDHEFVRTTAYVTKTREKLLRCKKCKLISTESYVNGYRAGHDKGYDAGRDSVECDC